MSKYRAPKLNLDAGYALSANYQDVFHVIHSINKKKKEDEDEEKKTTTTTPNSISW